MERLAAVAAWVALLPRKTFGGDAGAGLFRGTRSLIAAVACGLLLGVSGCGAPEGVAENALLNAYVSAPLCMEARQALAAVDARAGDVRVRAVCVDDSDRGGGSRLAAIGAAARRASEDSSSIVYIGTPDPTAVRFSEPILEEAGIARITASSGGSGVARLLRALRRADTSGSLRESVLDELE